MRAICKQLTLVQTLAHMWLVGNYCCFWRLLREEVCRLCKHISDRHTDSRKLVAVCGPSRDLMTWNSVLEIEQYCIYCRVRARAVAVLIGRKPHPITQQCVGKLRRRVNVRSW